ncbi:MAG: beta-N-acetylhexosaminidase [Bacteroidales bacterium]|nr:beta-N-acetylhexosaminidase [Bacteroidales bacterium]
MRKLILMTIVAVAVSACCGKVVEKVNLVPYPQEVTIENGSFDAAGATVRYSADADSLTVALAERLASQLTLATGEQSVVKKGRGFGINLVLDRSLAEEEYRLHVGCCRVVIKASSLRGFNWGVQTLKQLMPVQIYGDTTAEGINWAVPCCTISDAPRFGYRGLLIDEARHFFGMEAIKDVLDVMEIHKLNTLHWHLTEDQGWRIEIKKYPLLTEVGSIRKETLVGHLRRSNEYDGTPYGEGMWYSQDQISEIVDYAAARGINIIPEIDLPGHMQAALTAYPYLGCTGGPYEVWTKWGVSEDVLCIGKETTMQFVKDVLAEICDMFPSEYIHIGGDECPKVKWAECPHCQAKIKELGITGDDKHSPEHFLQSYMTAEAEKFLAERGRRLIGWDEILEGELAPNATVMSWRGTKGGEAAVKLGHDVIMTPYQYLYIDYYQSKDQANEPLAIGGYIPVERCYSFEPFTEEMTDEDKAHIIGVQANLWTEYIGTQDYLEYMLLPRLSALSEVQWCAPENKIWDRYLDSIDEVLNIYETAGYNYAKHILDVQKAANEQKNNQ